MTALEARVGLRRWEVAGALRAQGPGARDDRPDGSAIPTRSTGGSRHRRSSRRNRSSTGRRRARSTGNPDSDPRPDAPPPRTRDPRNGPCRDSSLPPCPARARRSSSTPVRCSRRGASTRGTRREASSREARGERRSRSGIRRSRRHDAPAGRRVQKRLWPGGERGEDGERRSRRSVRPVHDGQAPGTA